MQYRQQSQFLFNFCPRNPAQRHPSTRTFGQNKTSIEKRSIKDWIQLESDHLCEHWQGISSIFYIRYYLSIYQYIYIYIDIYVSVALLSVSTMHPSISPFIHLSICVCLCKYVYIYIHILWCFYHS